MNNPVIKIKEQRFLLSARKTIFWENKNTLIFSDSHFGKPTNFINSILQKPYDTNLAVENLKLAIEEFSTNRIIIVGDLLDAKSRINTAPLKEFILGLNKEVILLMIKTIVLCLYTYVFYTTINEQS